MSHFCFANWLNSWFRYGLITSFVGVLALLGVCWAACQPADKLSLGDYYHYRCDMEPSEPAVLQRAKPRFRFLTVSSLYANKIAEQLCHSDTMGRFYSGVTISWKPRWLLSPAEILNEDYDLIWSRENALHGLVPNVTDYYKLLLKFDNYSVSWFSKGSQPQLSQAYFADKRVGILRDTLSQTHHLLPLVSLKNANIHLSDAQLLVFDDASSLYSAFAKGEVDLITGGEWLRQEVDAPLNALFISDQVSAASLFLRRAHSPDIECELVQAVGIYRQKLTAIHMQVGNKENCRAS